MRYLTWFFLFALLFCLPLNSVALAEDADAKQQDKIIFKNGDVQSGKVFSAKFDKVTLGGKSFNTIDILKIVWFDSPPDYVEALDMIEEGEYDNAAFKLKLAADAQGVRDWLKLEIQMAHAEIAWRQAKWDDARKIYEDINKNFPDNFHLRTTTWRAAVAVMKLEKYEDAEKVFDSIAKTTSSETRRYTGTPCSGRFTPSRSVESTWMPTSSTSALPRIPSGRSQQTPRPFWFKTNPYPKSFDQLHASIMSPPTEAESAKRSQAKLLRLARSSWTFPRRRTIP
ncbi:MAG: hypothetical protein Kow00107_03130 [Planctomycetota bacterium]